MILASLRSGIAQVWSHKRVVLPFYLANLGLGLLVMLPLGVLVDDFVGNSMMREQLGVAMDYDVFFEFLLAPGGGLDAVQKLFVAAMVVYLLAALFLSGGALVVYANDTYRPAVFWGGAAACFGPFLRLATMSIPVFAMLFLIRLLEPLAQRLIFGSDPYENVIWWGAVIKTGLGYLGLILFGLVFDYARIHLVVTGSRTARRSLWFGLKFVWKNPGRTFSLALILFCAGWLVLFLYNLVSGVLTAPSWLVVIVILVVQQLYIIFRLALRLTRYSSQMHLYRRLA